MVLLLGQGHLHGKLLVANPLSQSALPPEAGRALTCRCAAAHGNRSRHRQRGPHTGVVVSLVLRCSGGGGGGSDDDTNDDVSIDTDADMHLSSGVMSLWT